MFCVIFHGLYGLRTMILDLGRKRERLLFWSCTVLGSVLFAAFWSSTSSTSPHDRTRRASGGRGPGGAAGGGGTGRPLRRGRAFQSPSRPLPFRRRPGRNQRRDGKRPGGRDDSPEKHAFDTIKGSDYLADQAAVLQMCRLAPEVVYEFEHWGAPFSRFADGTVAQRPFGGAGFPRTCYAADRTGHVLLHTLYEQAVRRGSRSTTSGPSRGSPWTTAAATD